MIGAGGEDYVELNRKINLGSGSRNRRCVGIVILNDDQLEGEEYFEVLIEGLGVSTRVTIVDDDGKWCIQ